MGDRMIRQLTASLAAVMVGSTIAPPGWASQPSEPVTPANVVNKIEALWEGEYERQFNRDLPARRISAAIVSEQLREMERRTGQRSALLYMMPRDNDVELVLVTGRSEPRIEIIPGASQATVNEAVKLLTRIRRQWFAKRKSIAAILKEVMTNEASVLVDTDAANKAADADLALQELGADYAVHYDMHDAREIDPADLDECDVYFKRSYSRTDSSSG